MSYMADPSGRSNAMYGSYKPAVLVGMQPPTADRMGEGMPTYTHLMQPATAPCMNQSALLDGRLPPTTLLTSTKPANLQDADKESCASEGWLDDDKFGAEDKGSEPGLHLLWCWFETCVASGSCCLNCAWWPVHAPGTDSDVVSFHCPIAGVALCTFCGGLWHCLGVHGVLCLCWSWASQKDKKNENWCCWWHGHRGGDAAACTQVVAIFPSYPPLWSLLQMVAKCHWSSQSPWICDSGGRFAVNWSAWDHGRHLACHLDRWEGLLWVWDRCGASFGIFRCSPGDWWANFQDPFWTDLKERDGPGMEEERALRGQQHQHRRQRASRGSWGWWVQWALRPWRLCVRSHKEPFWQRLLHQLHKLLVPASLDFRCKGGVLISQCAWVSLPWLKSQASMGKIKRTYIISRLGWWQSQWCGLKQTRIKRSKWLKGKKRHVELDVSINLHLQRAAASEASEWQNSSSKLAGRVASWTFFLKSKFQYPMVEALPFSPCGCHGTCFVAWHLCQSLSRSSAFGGEGEEIQTCNPFFHKICQDMLCWKISAVMRYQVLWTLLKDDIAKIYLAHLGTIGRHEWFGIQSLRQLRRHKTSGKQKTWNDFTETHDWRLHSSLSVNPRGCPACWKYVLYARTYVQFSSTLLILRCQHPQIVWMVVLANNNYHLSSS